MNPQGSPEWKAERLGKVTASRVVDIVARTKSGWGSSRANYMAQLIAERLTGEIQESFTNAAMQWGTDKEPEARGAYEFYRDAAVELVGFVPHPTIAMSGASPDGLVGADGLVEFKCPNTNTHIDTLLAGGIDDKYLKQMQWQLACTGRAWCDWVSFDPRMPENMRLYIERVPRDDKAIEALEKAVAEFLDEVTERVSKLEHRYGERPKRAFKDLSYPQQAGIRCGDAQFRQFMIETLGLSADYDLAEWVRRYCGVASRAELSTNADALAKWRRLEADYQRWLTDSKYAGSRRA